MFIFIYVDQLLYFKAIYKHYVPSLGNHNDIVGKLDITWRFLDQTSSLHTEGNITHSTDCVN